MIHSQKCRKVEYRSFVQKMLDVLPICPNRFSLTPSKPNRLTILNEHDKDHPQIVIPHTFYIPHPNLVPQPRKSPHPPPQLCRQVYRIQLTQPSLCSGDVKTGTVDSGVETGVGSGGESTVDTSRGLEEIGWGRAGRKGQVE